MNLEWTGAGHQELPLIWNTVEKFILEALDYHVYRGVDTYYFWEKIMRQEMQLWVLFDQEAIRGIMLTEVVLFGEEKIIEIPICAGGSTEAWKEFLLEVLEPWSREQRATRLEFKVRKGVSKLLTQHDYYVSSVVLTKRLNRMEH